MAPEGEDRTASCVYRYKNKQAMALSSKPMNSPSREARMHVAPAGEDPDEREFEAFAQEQDPLDIAAATWVSRRHQGLNAQGEAELQAWLDADPRHADAFEDMAGTLGDLQQLPENDVASLKTWLPETPAIPPVRLPATPRGLSHGSSWLPRLATAVIAVALIGGGLMGWGHWRGLPTFEQAYATTRGQQLTIRLPDAKTGSASTIELDTATRADARLYRDRREVHLTAGQAMLSVAPDAGRPFQVIAGQLRITVTGTRFSVRHTASGLEAGQTVVSVEEGHVRVEQLADQTKAKDPVVLKAGQKVVADHAGRLGPVQQVPPLSIATWRGGRLSFDQTPLAQAVAEFERYGHTGLVVRDPDVASLPIGGSYNVRQFQRFVEGLPYVLPVRLIPLGDLTEVVAR